MRSASAAVAGEHPPRTATSGLLAAVIVVAVVVTSELNLDSFGLASSGVDLARWAVLFPACFAPAVVILRSPSLAASLRHAPLVWFGGWLAWSLLSVVWSVRVRSTVMLGTARLVVFLFIVWFVLQYGWSRWLRVTAAGTTAFLIAGFAAEVVRGGGPEHGGRLVGLAVSPTSLGSFAALSLIVGLACWRDGGAVLLGGVCAAASVVALVWADARGASASALIASLVVLGRRARPAVLAAGALLAAALVVVTLTGESRHLGALSRSGDVEELTTLTGRTDVWPLAAELVAERPLRGYGTAASGDVYGEMVRDGRIWWEPHDSHSVYFTIAVETGLVGLVLFLAGVGSVIARASRRFRQWPWPLALLTVFLVNGLTESMILWPSLALVVVAAVTAAVMRPPAAPARRDGARALRSAAA